MVTSLPMVIDFAHVWMLKNQRNRRICSYMLMTADILNCQMYGHTWPHIETSSWAKNHIAELAVALNHTKNRNQKKWRGTSTPLRDTPRQCGNMVVPWNLPARFGSAMLIGLCMLKQTWWFQCDLRRFNNEKGCFQHHAKNDWELPSYHAPN